MIVTARRPGWVGLRLVTGAEYLARTPSSEWVAFQSLLQCNGIIKFRKKLGFFSLLICVPTYRSKCANISGII